MTNEPNKRFPRVSNCCKCPVAVQCEEDGFSFNYCTCCKNPCDVIADEGLQPSAPSMSLEEAKNIMTQWAKKKKDNRGHIAFQNPCRQNQVDRLGTRKALYVEKLILAASLLAASEQREHDIEKVMSVLSLLLKAKNPKGVLVKALQAISSPDSQQNISSKKD